MLSILLLNETFATFHQFKMEENKIIQYVVRYIYTYFQNCQKYVKENNNCLDIEQTLYLMKLLSWNHTAVHLSNSINSKCYLLPNPFVYCTVWGDIYLKISPRQSDWWTRNWKGIRKTWSSDNPTFSFQIWQLYCKISLNQTFKYLY